MTNMITYRNQKTVVRITLAVISFIAFLILWTTRHDDTNPQLDIAIGVNDKGNEDVFDTTDERVCNTLCKEYSVHNGVIIIC